MFILDPSHIGQKLAIKFQRGDGSLAFHEALIQHNGRNFILYSNADCFAQSRSGSDAYKYKYTLPGPHITQDLFGDRLVEIMIIPNEKNVEILQLKSSGSFRRVYKREGNMVFVGNVVKDSEHCKRPAVIITIMDADYLKTRGWATYKGETPAEDRVKEKSIRLQ